MFHSLHVIGCQDLVMLDVAFLPLGPILLFLQYTSYPSQSDLSRSFQQLVDVPLQPGRPFTKFILGRHAFLDVVCWTCLWLVVLLNACVLYLLLLLLSSSCCCSEWESSRHRFSWLDDSVSSESLELLFSLELPSEGIIYNWLVFSLAKNASGLDFVLAFYNLLSMWQFHEVGSKTLIFQKEYHLTISNSSDRIFWTFL